MECHQTQLRTRRYIELQTARARLLGLESGIEYAQALYAPDAFLDQKFHGELPPSVHALLEWKSPVRLRLASPVTR